MENLKRLENRLMEMRYTRFSVRDMLMGYDTTKFNSIYEYMCAEFGKSEASRLVTCIVDNAGEFNVDLSGAEKVAFYGQSLEEIRRAYIFTTILDSGKLEDEKLLITCSNIGKLTIQRLCEVSIVNRV